MDVTNPKLDDVRKVFAALPRKGRVVRFRGKTKLDPDIYSHIQGIAPYRSYHVLSHSIHGEPSGRLLVIDRTLGSEQLLAVVELPVLSSSAPFFFHPGGCQVLGDCLVVPVEDGGSRSVITFFDLSDIKNIKEVSELSRIERNTGRAGSVAATSFTRTGKTAWLLCAYDQGAADFYVFDQGFPGPSTLIFSKRLQETDLQSLCLLTDVNDEMFAIGFHRTAGLAGKDLATLYSVDLEAQSVTRLSQRHMKTDGPDDLIGSGPHFRWGAGVDIVSTTEIALFCTSRRYDSGCHINEFDSAKRSVRAVSRPTVQREAKKTQPQRKRQTEPAKLRTPPRASSVISRGATEREPRG